jgi:hypothetical protein
MADAVLDDAAIAQVNAANLPISLPSIEEIIADEDTSEFIYTKRYSKPEWPGGESGVTILLGYDLGYATHDKVDTDLKGKIPDAMLAACQSVVGIRGAPAYDAMLRVHNEIDIGWSVALGVFLSNDMPAWIATCQKYLPNFDLLSPDCKGVLVSLAYNRGPSFDNAGDRYREMRAIKADMVAEHFADVSNQLRSMARLWPPNNGVHSRRFREAALWDKGMKVIAPPPTAPQASA